jgi:ABC-type multidrug transport system fused ATPase/permease subunit
MSKNETGMKHRFFYLITPLVFVFLVLSTTIAAPKTVYAAPAPVVVAAVAPPSLSCPVTVLSWAICPVIDGIAAVVGQLDDFINKQMSIGTPGASSDPNQIFCDSGSTGNARTSCDAYYKAWASMRDIALGLMAVTAVIVLLAQALGFEILDAYTIRKVLPRLLISALAITLSWQLLQFAVTFSNDLAFGIRVLIYQPFTGLHAAALTGGSQFIGSLLSLGILTALGWVGLLSFVATAAVAVFLGVMVLVLRQLLIIMLVIFAPIAIVAYILPNTQRVYKLWWESFSKALLMFALISGMIAIGRVFSAVSSLNSTSPIDELAGFAAYFIPYFLIPVTFKFSGAALSQMSGFVNARGQGAFGALSKYRGNVAKKNLEDLKTGNRLHGENIRALGYGRFARRFNATTRETANLKNAGYNPRRMRERMAAARSTMATDTAKEALEKNNAVVAIKADDDLVEAALYAAQETKQGRRGGDFAVREELTRRGYHNVNEGTALIRAGRNSMDTNAFDTSMAIASFGTSSGWTPKYYTDSATGERVMVHSGGLGDGGETGAGGARQMINMVAGNDRQRAIQILGAARQQAESKGRFDLSGGSFTEDAEMLDQLHTGRLQANAVTQRVVRGALEGTGRGRLFGGHKRTIDAMAPQVKTQLDEAFGLAAGARPASPEEAIQQLAFAADAHDYASSNAPESARVLNEQVLSQRINVSELSPEMRRTFQPVIDRMATRETRQAIDPATRLPAVDGSGRPVMERVTVAERGVVTYGELMEGMRTDPRFGRYRREYGSGRTGEYAEGEARTHERPPE